jgi:uncharacterized protein YjbI with pentapeptide repeats
MANFTFSQLEKLFDHPASSWLRGSDLSRVDQTGIDLTEAKLTQANRFDLDLNKTDRTTLPAQDQPVGRNT